MKNKEKKLSSKDKKKYIDSKEFYKNLLYEKNHWDIPLSGFIILNDKKVFFVSLNEDVYEDHTYDADGELDTFYRYVIYNIYNLPDKIWKIENKQHEDFCKYVGEHWNYINGKRTIDKLKPSKTHHLFYDKYKNCESWKLNKDWLIDYLYVKYRCW